MITSAEKLQNRLKYTPKTMKCTADNRSKTTQIYSVPLYARFHFFSGFPIFSDYIIPEVNKLNINVLLQDMNKSFKHLLLNKQEIRFVEPLNRGQYSHLQINVG